MEGGDFSVDLLEIHLSYITPTVKYYHNIVFGQSREPCTFTIYEYYLNAEQLLPLFFILLHKWILIVLNVFLIYFLKTKRFYFIGSN